jgi:hypothetical protein
MFLKYLKKHVRIARNTAVNVIQFSVTRTLNGRKETQWLTTI